MTQPTQNTQDHPSIEFLKGNGVDQHGRNLADYLAFTDAEWDGCHDFIQWAFPTKTPSQYNRFVPVLPLNYTYDNDPVVLDNLNLLVDKFFAYLGIVLPDEGWGEPTLIRSKLKWLYNNDHNQLRISRLIECLSIFHPEASRAISGLFVLFIVPTFPDVVSTTTIAYWVGACQNIKPTKLTIQES